ncbi:hypothetical protein GCM10018980_74160 [Streptomyces capoamus]|uniref:Uncharacterized protein n=1 Tax=Streptomyces capoamus TaxID=68183 RepID=A0A919F4F2_9ACTN|nr:hypothetical protein [Streptomyces capoamus]GGP32741.1 hypothetical protein GCM10010501_75700 [Streptomyces libani subsp. rufus]GHG76317.1 hypothetical protein GCM10018980_74160 [Streptomyces capoamus]
MLAGWSPGRLSLAGPTPDLFPLPEGEGGLSEAESAAARDGRRRIAALADVGWYDGTKLACVAGIDAPEAVLRLQAVPPEPGCSPSCWTTRTASTRTTACASSG